MLLNTFLSLKSYPLKKARKTLQKIQQLSPQDFKDWQEKNRWEAARHHYDNNSTYRALFKAGFPKNWSDLPIVQKQHLQGNLETLLTSPYKRSQVHLGNTSGSSGHPFVYAKDKFAHAMTYALIADRYSWHGLSLRQRQARLYGIPLEGSSRWIEQMKDLLANRVRFPVFDLSDKMLDQFLYKFETNSFQYLYGYTSAMVLFAQYLIKKNRLLKNSCPSLTACIVTSEVCSQEDKRLLETAFGLPVINEYGASELDVIAFTDRAGDWILSEENLFVEILDENNQALPDGAEGKIIVTALHNRAFPMVRYEIGDMGSIARGKKSCLLQLTGRSNDVIQLPSGKKAAGLTFYYISRSILETGGTLKEFVIRQTALDTFVFDVVSEKALSEIETADIQRAMKLYLEDGLQLKINQVPQIERSGAGKIKHFYSLIP